MKKIVYMLVITGCILQADSTAYTQIAWTEVPKSALQTDDYYNPNKTILKEPSPAIVEEEIETSEPIISSTFYVTNDLKDESSKQDSVKLATPEWIFVD
jgi:hypothetical protein